MTEETKKLFDAPWRSHLKDDYVEDARDFVIAKCLNNPITNCISHLPELYDAMMETVYYKCFECMGGLRHNIDLTREELVKNGCPKQNKSNVCIYVKHIELLRKVRDGE